MKQNGHENKTKNYFEKCEIFAKRFFLFVENHSCIQYILSGGNETTLLKKSCADVDLTFSL